MPTTTTHENRDISGALSLDKPMRLDSYVITPASSQSCMKCLRDVLHADEGFLNAWQLTLLYHSLYFFSPKSQSVDLRVRRCSGFTSALGHDDVLRLRWFIIIVVTFPV